MQARQLTEARVDAEALVAGIRAALETDGELLDPGERGALEAAVNALEEMLSSDDAEVIRGATEQTGRASELFAARRMDRSIQQALAGVSLDSLEQDVGE
jgi:molecular chaperone HscA